MRDLLKEMGYQYENCSGDVEFVFVDVIEKPTYFLMTFLAVDEFQHIVYKRFLKLDEIDMREVGISVWVTLIEELDKYSENITIVFPQSHNLKENMLLNLIDIATLATGHNLYSASVPDLLKRLGITYKTIALNLGHTKLTQSVYEEIKAIVLISDYIANEENY